MGWNIVSEELGEFVEILPPQKRVERALVLRARRTPSTRTSTRSCARTRGISIVLSGDHVYKMDYSRMLRFHQERGAAVTLAAIEVPIADAQPLRRRRRRRTGARHGLRGKAERCRPRFPGRRISRWRRWASTSSTPTCSSASSRPTRAQPTTHDFGKDIIPALIHRAPVYAYRFYDENKKASKYWRDIGTLDAYFEANMDLCQVNPEFNLYDPGVAAADVSAAGAAGEVRASPKPAAAAARRSTRSSRPAASSRAAASTAACCARTSASTASRIIEQVHPDAGRARRPPRAHPPGDHRPRRAHSARRAHRLRPRRRSPPPHRHRHRASSSSRPTTSRSSDRSAKRRCASRRRPIGAAAALSGEATRNAVKITQSHAARDSRFARQPDGRSRRDARGRRVRTRGRAVGRVDRRARGARAARRRHDALQRQRRAEGRRATSTARSRSAIVQPRARSARARRSDDRARRHADQEPSSAPTRCSACRWRPRSADAAAKRVPLYRHLGALYGNDTLHAARADDEHPQRRRARRHQRRLPGVHGHAGRRAGRSPRRCAPGAEIFHALRGILKKRGPVDRRRRRRRLRAESEVESRGASRSCSRPSARPGMKAGQRRVHRARRRVERALGRRRPLYASRNPASPIARRTR